MRTKIYVLIGLCYILILHKVICQEDFTCEPPWTKIWRGCYMFLKQSFYSWENARNDCISRGGDLFVINSAKEMDKVGQKLRSQIINVSLLQWWIGLKHGTDLQEWRWVDGTTLKPSETPWARNEPDLSECGVYNYQDNLKDENCTTLKPYVCEITVALTADSSTTPSATTTTVATTTAQTAATTSTTTLTTKATTVVTETTESAKATSTTEEATPAPVQTTKDAASATTSTTAQTADQTTDKKTEETTQSGQETMETKQETTAETTSVETVSDTTSSPGTMVKTSEVVTMTTANGTTTAHDSSPFIGCYAENTEETCPPVNISGFSWPRTEAGRMAQIDCGQGKSAKWKCQAAPVVCWKGEPDVSRCTLETTLEPAVTTATTVVTTTALDLSDFDGCYSVNHEDTCPPVIVLGVSWPRTERGKTIRVECGEGKSAKWKCQSQPVVCWKGEPDVSKCTSEAIQNLTNQAEEILKSENNSAAAIEFMDNLADSVVETQSESDLFQSTKLMSTAKKAKPANEQAAKDIVKNTLKCGNNIISSTKKIKTMDSDAQILIASSLLTAVEDITMTMMKSINTTGVSRIEEPNLEVELQVVDIDDGIGSVKYEGQSNTNTFTIPTKTIREYTSERPVKLAFIQYHDINKLLEPTNRGQDDNSERVVISDVVSASIGRSDNQSTSELSQPLRFSFETGKRGGKEDFNKLCSFWNFSLGHTGAWSQKGCELASYNATHTTCKCYHLTNFAILMDIHATKIPEVHRLSLMYITYVGCIISIICLFLSLVTFTCLSLRRCARTLDSEGSRSSGSQTSNVRSVQGERNSVHKNLVFCLFVAEVLFLAGVERTENKVACSIIAGFLHFFFLSSFSWMFVEGIHILFMLVQVFDSAKSRLKYYYLIGYGAPVIIVGVSAAVYHEGYGTDQYCWLTSERLFIWSFAGPVAFILLVNLIVLTYAMASVCKHSEYVFTKDKSKSGNMKGWIQGALALEVLLGLTWVFGYFYISAEAVPIAYLFTIFNSLQGVFIFVFHCLMNKKVRKEYQKFIEYNPSWATSKSANGTAGHGTGSSGLALSTSRKKSDPSRKQSDTSRKNSDFSDINPDRRKTSNFSAENQNNLHDDGWRNSDYNGISLEGQRSSYA